MCGNTFRLGYDTCSAQTFFISYQALLIVKQLFHKHIYKTVLLLLAFAGVLPCNAQYMDTVCTGYTGRMYGADSVAGQSYTWIVQGGAITAGQGGPTITVNWGSVAGTGMVMAVPQMAGGCDGDTLKGLVLIDNKYKVSITAPNMACADETVQLIGSGAVNYQWSTGDITDTVNITITTDSTVWLLGNNGACQSDTAYTFITAIVTPQAAIISGVTTEAYQGDVVLFDFGGSDAERVFWQVDNNKQTLSPQQTFAPALTIAGNYTVMQVAANKGLCFDTAYYSFAMQPLGDVFIPNAFTPNEDSYNNVFEIDGNGNTYLELKIYDRWGALIYEAIGTDRITWNGFYKGAPVPEGVYAYQVSAKRGVNTTKHYRGSVTVIR
jgi:gliding motility-associated-like protein